MPPDSKDMARLWDILDAARAVVAFTEKLGYEDFVLSAQVILTLCLSLRRKR